MRRCRFCPHSVPVPGTTLRRPLQIYKKYPGFETKVISFFFETFRGAFLILLSNPPSSVAFSRTLSRVALPPSPVRRVPIYIYNPRKTRWLCGEFPGVAGGLPAGALAGLSLPQQMLRQKFAHRFVVQPQAQPCQDYRTEEKCQGTGQRLPEREVAVFDPGVVEVYEGIVHHVEGIGYVPQN